MAKRKKQKSEADYGVEVKQTKQQILKNAVASASIYVTVDAAKKCHITCFDGQVRTQADGRLRAFDSLYILLQQTAWHTFEDFFEQFHAVGSIDGALLAMQGKMNHAPKTVKAEAHEMRKRALDAEATLEKIRKLTVSIKSGKGGNGGEASDPMDIKRKLAHLIAHG